jgi:hypothetical protein
VVDGSNVAHTERSNRGDPKVSNLIKVRKKLKSMGYEPLVIVDASLKHEIDDPYQLESLIDSQVVRQAPAGTDADYFILEIAEEQDAYVVSNDVFDKYRDRHDWIENRRIPLMIVEGKVVLREPDAGEE